MSTNGVSHPEQYSAPGSNPTTEASQSSSGGKFSKDEVGWYFVEQYYTTLSKSPDKLHLFHGNKSQFVYGREAEVSPVSVGRKDIQERIQKLDFQDCKVRISNVDAQASYDNIVIQVIGETSNKSEESRKFVQTFVLAQQPSGYFVLNDIMRFIKEEEEETAEVVAPVEAAEPTAPEAKLEPQPEPEPQPQPQPAEVPEVAAPKAELDTAVVDKKLEEATATAPELESAPIVAVPVEVAASPVAPAPVEAASTPAEVLDAQKIVEEVAEEEVKKAETPKDPSPTPAAVRAAPVAAAPPVEAEKPKEPPKPMTWASRAAAAAGTARPPVALPKPATPPANPTKPPAAAATTTAPSAAKAPAENTAAATATPAAAAAGKDSGNEWQTAGSDSKRQNRPQSISTSVQDKDKALGYVKYVTEKVDEATLRQHLEQFGPVVYFDINRSKNCAFIEFASQAGYLAAVAANPHVINGENIMVEARRPKASAYGGANYSNNRGGMSGRGRGGYEGRAGSQGGGRGGFSGPNRGRGGAAGAARGGRGASQVANA